MGRKQLDLAEKVVGALIQEVGPRAFMTAVNNATAHGGVLLHADGVYLDHEDKKLNAWHRGIEEMTSVAKWLEGDESQAEYFMGQNAAEKHGASKPRLADRLGGTRTLSQMGAGDVTQHSIVTLEHLVWELTGEKVQFLRETGDRKTHVVLRCGLAMFMHTIVDAMHVDEGRFDQVVYEFAKCVSENGVTVNWKHYEFKCSKSWNCVKRIDVQHEDEDADFPPEEAQSWYVEISRFEDFIEAHLGTRFDVIEVPEKLNLSDDEEQDYEISNGLKLPMPKSEFGYMLEGFVDRRRNIGYVIDTFKDRFDIALTTKPVRQRVVGGPGKGSIHPRIARRDAEQAIN